MTNLNIFNQKNFLFLTFLGTLLLLSSCFKMPAGQEKPTLFLIGDSTVKNGKGKGDGGLWGWGSFIATYFDTTKINVENHALGGTSSRTFRTQGHWDKVLVKIKPGDYVFMQFGHNDSSPINDDSRARGTIKSNGDETEEIDNILTMKHEVVHSYGWYLRQFVQEIKAKGATPVILSPIPRNNWNAGKVNRSDRDYGKWAAEAAAQEKVMFIDLNKIISDQYDIIGEATVKSTYFNTSDHTHPIEAGARFNAAAVVTGLKKLNKHPLQKYLTASAKKTDLFKK